MLKRTLIAMAAIIDARLMFIVVERDVVFSWSGLVGSVVACCGSENVKASNINTYPTPVYSQSESYKSVAYCAVCDR